MTFILGSLVFFTLAYGWFKGQRGNDADRSDNRPRSPPFKEARRTEESQAAVRNQPISCDRGQRKD